MPHPIIVSYNSTSRTESKFVNNLADYLNSKRLDIEPYDPNIAAQRMSQQLTTAKWFIVILTPGAIQSPQVQSLVNIAFSSIKQGHLQGVLALTTPSNPIELDDLPPLWSTLRIYYTGERNEDLQQTFEKLYRTLDDKRATVPGTSTSNNNWAYSAYNSGAFRPQATTRQTPQSSLPRLFIALVAALVLIIFFLAYYLGASLIFRRQSTPTNSKQVTVTAVETLTAIARTNTKVTATAHANATAQTHATAIVVSQDNLIYTHGTSGNPYLTSFNGQDTDKQWKSDSACVLHADDTYHVMSTSNGQYKLCMANNTNFRNFAYQVDMSIINGDAGGLIFGWNGANRFYRFSLNIKGTYELFVCQPDTCSDTSNDNGQQLRIGSLKDVNNTNTLTVIAIDKNIYLYINGVFKDEVNNANVDQIGEIGVYASSDTQPTEVTFSNLKVWKL